MRLMVPAVTIAALLSAANAGGASHAEAVNQANREFRFFRIQVYQTYRTARPEYDRRRRAGEEVFQAWQAAGGQPQQVEPLVAWYREAKAASLPRMNRPLPPLPEFPEAIVQHVEPAPPDEPQPRATEAARSFKHYRVREVPSRSTLNPQPSVARTSPNKQSKMNKTIWKSVSRALLRGMTRGAAGPQAGK